jgi:hypothetical protein
MIGKSLQTAPFRKKTVQIKKNRKIGSTAGVFFEPTLERKGKISKLILLDLMERSI